MKNSQLLEVKIFRIIKDQNTASTMQSRSMKAREIMLKQIVRSADKFTRK